MNKFTAQIINNSSQLESCEKKFRKFPDNEYIPSASRSGTAQASYVELATQVFPDKDGPWRHSLWICKSFHEVSLGVNNICRTAYNFLSKNKENPVDLLSLQAGIEGGELALIFLVRVYKNLPDMPQLNLILGEKKVKKSGPVEKLIIPQKAVFHYTEKEKQEHENLWKRQEAEKNEKREKPFLNRVHSYVQRKLYDIDPEAEPIYDLKAIERMNRETYSNYDEFIKHYQQIKKAMILTNEATYYQAFHNKAKYREFWDFLEVHVKNNYILKNKIRQEENPLLMKMLETAFFQYDVLQTPINDPAVTDIHVNGPSSIRVKVDGRWYLSNVTFIDEKDYERFMKGLEERNNVPLKDPTPIFTDNQTDKNYILRFSLTRPYATSNGCYALHISKQPKKKLLFKDLASDKFKMLPLHVMDYVIDRMRNGRGVIIAGAPRSGKTVFLNAAIEPGYENSAEILIIQESDELFPYRNGVTVQHVVVHDGITLDTLAKSATVSGCDVFIIGETRGGEFAKALKIAESGTRVALTTHGESATDTIDRLALLAMEGMPNLTMELAVREIAKGFDTVIYMEHFHVQEIVEIDGYDDKNKRINWTKVYEYNPDDPLNEYYPAPAEEKKDADNSD